MFCGVLSLVLQYLPRQLLTIGVAGVCNTFISDAGRRKADSASRDGLAPELREISAVCEPKWFSIQFNCGASQVFRGECIALAGCGQIEIEAMLPVSVDDQESYAAWA